jgi:hypothetical protein
LDPIPFLDPHPVHLTVGFQKIRVDEKMKGLFIFLEGWTRTLNRSSQHPGLVTLDAQGPAHPHGSQPTVVYYPCPTWNPYETLFGWAIFLLLIGFELKAVENSNFQTFEK